VGRVSERPPLCFPVWNDLDEMNAVSAYIDGLEAENKRLRAENNELEFDAKMVLPECQERNRALEKTLRIVLGGLAARELDLWVRDRAIRRRAGKRKGWL
jgi:hypothetical protein